MDLKIKNRGNFVRLGLDKNESSIIIESGGGMNIIFIPILFKFGDMVK